MFKQKIQENFLYRLICHCVIISFLVSLLEVNVYAEVFSQNILNLPNPGVRVAVTPHYSPLIIKGLTVYPNNPLELDFIVDRGDSRLNDKALKNESKKLIKYFLAALTVPEDQMWVNLSPYEKNRIIPKSFGDTEMGRDLLAQDYMLKQLTASLMFPEEQLGKKFWDRVFEKAYQEFGTTDIPMNTFNKVWIVPENSIVFEQGKSAFIVDKHFKVMLEEEEENRKLTTEIIRTIIIPEIEKEVNTGKTFANLRQIYNSAILAKWYKDRLRKSLLGEVYVGQSKTKGIDTKDKQINQKIYAQYLEAFKKGVYDYIKEEYDTNTQEIIPRKYFSGGSDVAMIQNRYIDLASLSPKHKSELDFAALNIKAKLGDINKTTRDESMLGDMDIVKAINQMTIDPLVFENGVFQRV